MINGAQITDLTLQVLGLVALLRAKPKDIPEVVRELSRWWHPGS